MGRWLDKCAEPAVLAVVLAGFMPGMATAGYRTFDSFVESFDIDFSYPMIGSGSQLIELAGFDNTEGIVEGVKIEYTLNTAMYWDQRLYEQVPVGTQFASGAGGMVIGFRGVSLGNDVVLNRSISLSCVQNQDNSCYPFRNSGSSSFSESNSFELLQMFESQRIGSSISLNAINHEEPNPLGAYDGTYHTWGQVSVTYTYDTTTEAQYALELYNQAKNSYLSELGPGDEFDQVEFSHKLAAMAASGFREDTSEINHQSLKDNQRLKRLEYAARGISGSLLWSDDSGRELDSNDKMNKYIWITAPGYVFLKKALYDTVGITWFVDVTNGEPSATRLADIHAAYAGYFQEWNSVEDALNKIYGLDLQPVESKPLPKRVQLAPDERQSGEMVAFVFGDDGPRFEAVAFASIVERPSDPILFDPPNWEQTLVSILGPTVGAVQILDPEGHALRFTVEVGGQIFEVAAGDVFDFIVASFADGVDRFYLSGIDPDLPEYDMRLWFTETGAVSVVAFNTIAVPVPEAPAAWMLGAGLLLMAGTLRKTRRAGRFACRGRGRARRSAPMMGSARAGSYRGFRRLLRHVGL